jgi:hypothetical protein
MLIWSALITAVLTGLTLGLFTTGVSEWATQAAELVTVVAVFVLVCLSRFQRGSQRMQAMIP